MTLTITYMIHSSMIIYTTPTIYYDHYNNLLQTYFNLFKFQDNFFMGRLYFHFLHMFYGKNPLSMKGRKFCEIIILALLAS